MNIGGRVQRANTTLFALGVGCVLVAVVGAGLSVGGVSAKGLTTGGAIALGAVGVGLMIASLYIGVEPVPATRAAPHSEPVGSALGEPATAALSIAREQVPPTPERMQPQSVRRAGARQATPRRRAVSSAAVAQARLLRSEIGEALAKARTTLDDGEWPVRWEPTWRESWPKRSEGLAVSMRTPHFDVVGEARAPLEELQNGFSFDRGYNRELSDLDRVFLERVTPVLRRVGDQLNAFLEEAHETSDS